MDYEEVAEELYSLPPERFTAVRTEREKQARSAGDRELATRIHGLSKPNTVAWLANQLARRHADELRPLLELGALLREATATLQGEQLRTLTRQRHQVVYALVQQARTLAVAAGHRMTDDTARGVEQTLTAALADPEAAERLAAGRLTEGIEPAGFAPSDAAPQQKPAARPKPANDPTERERRRAEQEYDAARAAVATARDARAQADRRVHDRHADAEEASAESDRLRRELRRAEEAQRRAEQAEERARAALTKAEDQLRRAEERERDAGKRLAGLSAARADHSTGVG